MKETGLLHAGRGLFIFSLLSIVLFSRVIISTSKTSKEDKFSGLTFSVLYGDPVHMHVFDTAHYQLDKDGRDEYARLMPSGGHTVHILTHATESHPEPYTVTLFHQLKCLEIYHREYTTNGPLPPSNIVQHCLNYLRQTTLCSMDLGLESIHSALASERKYDTICRDWTSLYDEAERNYGAYQIWLNRSDII